MMFESFIKNNFWDLINSLITLVSVIVLLFSVSEMKKQRLNTFKPDIFIERLGFLVRFSSDDNEVSGSITTSYGTSKNQRFINIGNSIAKNVTVTFCYDAIEYRRLFLLSSINEKPISDNVDLVKRIQTFLETIKERPKTEFFFPYIEEGNEKLKEIDMDDQIYNYISFEVFELRWKHISDEENVDVIFTETSHKKELMPIPVMIKYDDISGKTRIDYKILRPKVFYRSSVKQGSMLIDCFPSNGNFYMKHKRSIDRKIKRVSKVPTDNKLFMSLYSRIYPTL